MDIDFINIKYNLYEILNIINKDDIIKIKKQYIKTLKSFHPDKNSNLEQDIYHHIILAGKILLNDQLKEKYDKFISEDSKVHFELKDNFKKNINNVNNYTDNFETLNNNYNLKHGYNELNNSSNILENFNNYKNNLNKCYQKIDELDEINYIKDSEIIQIPDELSIYVIGDNYTHIEDLDKLYMTDSIQTSNFTSLDKAFIKYKNVEFIDDNKSLIDKINEYNNTMTDSIQTSNFTSLDKAFIKYKNVEFIDYNKSLIDKINEYNNTIY